MVPNLYHKTHWLRIAGGAPSLDSFDPFEIRDDVTAYALIWEWAGSECTLEGLEVVLAFEKLRRSKLTVLFCP